MGINLKQYQQGSNQNHGKRKQRLALGEPSLQDWVKEKPAQGKAKRGKGSTRTLSQDSNIQATGPPSQSLLSSMPYETRQAPLAQRRLTRPRRW